MISSYDDMGPRIDLGSESPAAGPTAANWNPSPPKTRGRLRLPPGWLPPRAAPGPWAW